MNFKPGDEVIAIMDTIAPTTQTVIKKGTILIVQEIMREYHDMEYRGDAISFCDWRLTRSYYYKISDFEHYDRFGGNLAILEEIL